MPNKKLPETTIKQFKRSLNQLINTLMTKQPSYIKCIKPNDYKEPGQYVVCAAKHTYHIPYFISSGVKLSVCMVFVSDEFDDEVVKNQVKYMGLVEILRIRKAGFAFRENFDEFLNRYKSLCPDTWPHWTRCCANASEAVKRLIEHIGCTKDDYKIGKCVYKWVPDHFPE